MRAPETRMNILRPLEIDDIISRSNLVSKYNTVINSQSAYEILEEKIDKAQKKAAQEKLKEAQVKAKKATGRSKKKWVGWRKFPRTAWFVRWGEPYLKS